MGYIKEDAQYVRFKQLCKTGEMSPRLEKFIGGLVTGETGGKVQFDNLRNTLLIDAKMEDGTIWRVMGSQRSYSEQADIYKRGRVVEVIPEANLNGGIRYKYIKDTITNVNDVATYAKGGESYHNFGLAVDICFRAFGDSLEEWKKYIRKTYGIGQTEFKLNKEGFKKFYEKCGLLAWASECGLVWGGNWSKPWDVVHFQDSSCTLPKNAYSNDCNYRHVAKTAKKIDNSLPVSTETTGSVSAVFWLCLLGLALGLFFKKGGKKY